MQHTASLKKAVYQSLAIATMAVSASAVMAAEPSHLEHPHSAGTFMFEYKYMRMSMDGLRDGTDDVSSAEARDMMGDYGHMMVPTDMTMNMHMFMPMYNITKDLSVMLMANYISNEMEMEGMMGDMDMESSGIGDTEVSMSYKFADDSMAFSFGLSIPTGSIDEDDTMDMLMANGMVMKDMPMNLPYAMQLGSGTYDVEPSLTYLGAYYDLRYGAQVSYKYRIDENDNGYTLGDEATAMAWIRKPVAGVNLSAELEVVRWGDIEGEDPDVMKTMFMDMNGMIMPMKASPTNFTSNYGGKRAELTVGAAMPVGMATVGLEVGYPVYQDLNGLQMKRAMSFALSAAAMF